MSFDFVKENAARTNRNPLHRCRFPPHCLCGLLVTAMMSTLSSASRQVLAVEERHRHNLVGRNPFNVLKLSWIRKERSTNQSYSTGHCPTSKLINGSCVVRKHPDRQSVATWFGLEHSRSDVEHRNRVKNAAAHCNHPLAGMTNPTLHVFDRVSHPNSCVIPASLSTEVPKEKNEETSKFPWWPRVACEPPGRSWRVLRFRENVGAGRDCYQACRDAALAWEFNAGHKGIVSVQSDRGAFDPNHSTQRRRGWLGSKSSEGVSSNLPIPFEPVQQIWWGPGRRLVTYTAVGLSWLKLYTISPVTVVYDVIDQRGVGTTYTSTAYATGAGHWIRGEERVTVCHRDADDTVDVEILSYSQAASDTLMGRLAWPVLGKMQQSFFRQQLAALQRIGREATPQAAVQK